jgi:two-component system CheB/CheR fusion protein
LITSNPKSNKNENATAVEAVITEGQLVTAVNVPIVGIGASAGGLEAFVGFFKACPLDTGMAFVLVSHLSSNHHSLLTEILQRSTSMPVTEVVEQDPVAANHVYIIPPAHHMVLVNGILQLSKMGSEETLHYPINVFFHSLAKDQGKRAIGIILSGTASDGTLGCRSILDEGGVCMVQTPSTAKFDSMPQSAIDAGYVTHILNVEDMPSVLQELSRQSIYRIKVPPPIAPQTLSSLNQILLQIRNITGHDFSLYKKTTIGRRIDYRMGLNNITDMAVYERFLEKDANEVRALFSDMLINVTHFFRDPEAFVMLKQQILPTLLANKPDDYVFRVWVAACSSGEEAYSIAIVLQELMDEMQKDFKIKIYATDLDDKVINRARAGRYPVDIAKYVEPERLLRFFSLDDNGYKINKHIRQMVVFAVQSVIKDPPFTKLDLLSCRNLMIYLEQEQQNRLIPLFHFALNPGGVLFLSNSESIIKQRYLFKPLNRKLRFYQALKTAAKPALTQFENTTMTSRDTPVPQKNSVSQVPASNLAALTNRILLQSYAPASVTTDAKGNILYVHGDTSLFMSTPTGPVTTNVIDMVHLGLKVALRKALQAATRGEPTLNSEMTINTKEGEIRVNLCVRRLSMPTTETNDDEPLLLLSFQNVVVPPVVKHKRGKSVKVSQEHSQNQLLESDLVYARENQQAAIEEMQATNEELKSANEELQSTNEELQSTNEELETSKEELQSLNEETTTVNSELNTKIEQLSVSQNDLRNLMDNVNTGIVFMDYELNIRSYTREAVKAYRLIATDIGRPLSDITTNLQGGNLVAEMLTVLETLIPREIEVQTYDGVYYLARIQAYRTMDNVIQGVVLSFTDTDSLRKTTIKLAELQLVQQLTEGIVNTVVEPLVVLNSELQVIKASNGFLEYFMVTTEQTIGYKIYELGNGQWNIPALRELLEEILPQRQTIEGFEVEHEFPELGKRRMVLNARRIKSSLGDTELILLAMVNIEVKD